MPAPAQLDQPVTAPQPRWGRLRLGLAALLTLGAAAVVLVPSLSAGADPTPAATANQTTNLIDQQVIAVSLTGVTPGSEVFLRECNAAPVSVMADCSNNAPASVAINSDGTGTDVVQLSIGAIATNAMCDSAHACTIQVQTNINTVPGITALPILFAPTNGSCPTYSSQAAGLGSSAANRAFIGWVPTTCQAPYADSIDWSTGNDVDGRRNLANGARDWAVSERSLDPATNKVAAGTTFSYAPLTLSALGFAYNLRDRTTGERITDLRLTPELLIELFKGELTTWQDPRIERLNPDHDFPVTAKAIARADACNASLAVTSWFETVDKADYESGNSIYASQGKTDLFPVPRGNTTIPVTGEAALLNALTNPKLADTNYDPASEGFVGFLDTSVAAISALPSVTIVTDATAASPGIAPTQDSILKGLGHMQADANGVLSADYATADSTSTHYDPASYPLPTVTYAILPTSGTTAAKAGWMTSFFSYATGNSGTGNGQDAGLEQGYVALPKTLRTQAATAIAAITVTAPPASPTPTASPTVAAATAGPTTPVVIAPTLAPASPAATTPAARTTAPAATAKPTTATTSAAPTSAQDPAATSAPVSTEQASLPISAPVDQVPAQVPVQQVPVDSGATAPALVDAAAAPEVVASDTAPTAAGESAAPVTEVAPTAQTAQTTTDVTPAAFARQSGSGASLVLPVLVLLALAGLLAGPVLLRRVGA